MFIMFDTASIFLPRETKLKCFSCLSGRHYSFDKLQLGVSMSMSIIFHHKFVSFVVVRKQYEQRYPISCRTIETCGSLSRLVDSSCSDPFDDDAIIERFQLKILNIIYCDAHSLRVQSIATSIHSHNCNWSALISVKHTHCR